MESKGLERLSFPEIRAMVESGGFGDHPAPYLGKGIGMFHAGTPDVFHRMLKMGTPYIIEEPRFCIIESGSARVAINMMEREFRPGMLVYMGKGCIIQPIGFNPGIALSGLMLGNEKVETVMGKAASPRDASPVCFLVDATEDQVLLVSRMFGLIWEMIHREGLPDNVIDGQLQSLANLFIHLDGLSRGGEVQAKPRGRLLFERFIDLLNAHCARRHALGFFADRMCVTPRHLGHVVRQESGMSAKDWIDRAMLTSAKISLAATDRTVASISNEMDFPNPSFFSKFFKRMAGVTPQAYRDGLRAAGGGP